MNESASTAKLIVQVRDRESFDLLVTTDDLEVVSATMHALVGRLGLKASVKSSPPSLRVVKPAHVPPDEPGGH